MTLKLYTSLLAQIKTECLFDSSFRDKDISALAQTLFVCVCVCASLSLSALQELLSLMMRRMMFEQENMLKD